MKHNTIATRLDRALWAFLALLGGIVIIRRYRWRKRIGDPLLNAPEEPWYWQVYRGLKINTF